MSTLSIYFNEEGNPRTGNAPRHNFCDLMTISLLCALCGGETAVDMEHFGQMKEDFLRELLDLPYGIPCHDAYSRLFRLMKPTSLQAFFDEFRSDFAEAYTEQPAIAIDGKEMRRSFDKAAAQSNLNVVTAFAHGARLSFGMTQSAKGGGEIPALRELIEMLDIRGITITADALYCQRETCELIEQEDGDDCMQLKGNQGDMQADVRAFVTDQDTVYIDDYTSVDGWHPLGSVLLTQLTERLQKTRRIGSKMRHVSQPHNVRTIYKHVPDALNIHMTQQQNASWQITKPATTSPNGIVAAQSRVAAAVGAEIMAQGGNAVDAAIATSFALGATEPWMSGMGGGGYMVVRMVDDPIPKVIEFGMRAPGKLRPVDYPIVGGKADDLFPWPAVLDDRNVYGAKSVAVPGQVAGMGMAHESFASMEWAKLLAPAIALADVGLPVDWYAQLILGGSAGDLAAFPASAETFLDGQGYPKASGWTALADTRCDLSRLAASLRVVATDGPSAFYEGPLADSIIADLQAAGGRHCGADLTTYEATLVEAKIHPYRDHQIISTPNLTAGPTLNHVLDLLADWQPAGTAPDATAYAAYDRAIRAANAHRYATMGDTEHEPSRSCTSHFNVVDGAGNMVSCTQTLLSIFGSRLMLPTSGIMMNNGIMWFDPEPGKPNSIGPGKRCLANMCPTILSRSDGAMFALGASGGRKIMPCVAQLTSMVLDYGMDLNTALHTPRIDSSLAEVTIVDDCLPAETLHALRDTLPAIQPAPRTIYPLHYACPSAVSRQDGINSGATEIMAPWADAVAEG